jgi:hypothetical protein
MDRIDQILDLLSDRRIAQIEEKGCGSIEVSFTTLSGGLACPALASSLADNAGFCRAFGE